MMGRISPSSTDADLKQAFWRQVAAVLEARPAAAEKGMLIDPPFAPLSQAEHATQRACMAAWSSLAR